MARKLTFRQLVVLILALWNDLSQKEISRRTGLTQGRVSQFLTRQRQKEMDDEVYELLLSAVSHRRAAVSLVRACLEALDALGDPRSGLTEDEEEVIEESILHASRLMRRYLRAVALRSRAPRPAGGYPGALDVEVCRHWAGEQLAKLKRIHARPRFAVVRLDEDFQTWALVERCCEESVRETSRSLKRAASWARLAMVIARFVSGPEGWRSRVAAYALAHWANLLRIRGKLQEAEVRMEEAKRLWEAGSDPAGVLDPGRLLELEGSLRRDQRRFEEALDLFDRAAAVGRSPERALLNKGTTYEIIGEHEQAVAVYLAAEPEVARRGDPRLAYMLRFNLAASYCHLDRHETAAGLLRQVRDLVAVRGDRIETIRVTWLEGRILAGLGRPREARRLLGEARHGFAAEGLPYDEAVALLEEVSLLLEEGRTAEVKALSLNLAAIFESKGVHREALAALQVFEEAVKREAATAELARRVLRFLFHARHDQGLRFES